MILKSVFQIMVFSSLVSCIPEKDDNPDIEDTSYVRIFNSCDDTIYYQETQRVYNAPEISVRSPIYAILPYKDYILNWHMSNCSRKDFLCQWYDFQDTVWFRKKSKTIQFIGPMSNQFNNTKDYFNYNSWDSVSFINKDGNSKILLQYTLTDNDFE